MYGMLCVWNMPARIVAGVTLGLTSDFIVNGAHFASQLSP